LVETLPDASAMTGPPVGAGAVFGQRASRKRAFGMRVTLTLSDWLPPRMW
jgi:hypothetical protein